jgi:hypothetical protein
VEYFLIFLGLFTYSELYCFYAYEQSILDISFEAIKENLTLSSIFKYLIYLTFLFAVFSEVLLYFVEVFILKLDFSNEMEYLKEKSIKNNLSSAYNYYQYKLTEISKYKLLKKIILTDILLISIDLITSYFLDKTSILEYLYTPFSANIYLKLVFILIIGFPLIMLYFFIKGYVTNEWNANIDIKGYEEINQKFWLDELSLGLIDKKAMFEHLEFLILQNTIYSNRLPSNDRKINESIKFCKHFGLQKAHSQTLDLTSKGKFFSKYILEKDPFKPISIDNKE